ncbi:uncharacterized protein HMPREF1541_06214 [Cyphellophora europaea CBS 101466]|uniref:dolichol kinase n=1 Tax=Cyphellophora europaea (strain CBS 101466) TaxID=1220924 RepID=W2RR36_CYPE1|nr:uncharacterized protein HMPREF1541_06214 [Cyphellophora europaea CBS 101466]ETN38183.1 hypothetical protein HMPREF1541_06214 [Cyphellophora europaea CBS 101466]
MKHLSPPDERRHRSDGPNSEETRSRFALERSPHPYLRRSETLKQDDAQKASPTSSNPSSRSESTESGTEADDEKGLLLRGLPAPPLRSHKGLRGSTPRGLSPALSPLPTPPATKELSFFDTKSEQDVRDELERRRKQESYRQRKKAELVRRSTETLLLLAMILIIWESAGGIGQLRPWTGEICLAALVPVAFYTLYPLRQTQRQYHLGRPFTRALRAGFYIPSRFDPGPLLYPVILPTTIAISLYGQNPAYLPLSLACGLASLPEVVTWIYPEPELVWYLRWCSTLVPWSNLLQESLFGMNSGPISLKLDDFLEAEDLTLIFPLHRFLRSSLEYLTTTSLDPAELELLATGLIHLLVFAQSPQAQVLKSVLWLGGLSIFVTCRHLMQWEVELARIPRWRFAKVPHKSALSHRLQRAFSAFMSEPVPTSESSDDDIDNRAKPQPKSLKRVRTLADPCVSVKARQSIKVAINGSVLAPRRRNTISDLDSTTKDAVEKRSARHRQIPSSPFLSLTWQQARIRKYLYAAVVYLIVLVIIMGPVRYYVGVRALHGNEAFGWAGGYLFGSLPFFRGLVHDLNLAWWIRLPPMPDAYTTILPNTIERLITLVSFPANVRLCLGAYCILVISLGIIAVLQLTAYVEVDTRRKVFHGVMVVMLLPTIFVDPCYLALALGLILALFLLLDLFRAAQLPPVSRPLTNFLAPYVDGRDHRGPVIVSHIFLLIGCAIPLWLSLADIPRSGDDPWRGWDVQRRELSMISGVVCVGMGDAAASLIGRRFGRTKWYWGGGKSLEGSVAFAAAVTIGLFLAWIWLRVGGWLPWDGDMVAAGTAFVKCAIAASGASLLESVLTAANDNVVVPVGLWLLVRGLQV